MKLEDKVPKNDAADNSWETRIAEVVQDHTKEISEETPTIKVMQEVEKETNGKIQMDQDEGEITSLSTTSQNISTVWEIEEERIENGRREERSHDVSKRKVCISPEVEEALGTLEKVIAVVREYGRNAHRRPQSSIDKDSKYHEEAGMEKSTPAGGRTSSDDQAAAEVLNKETAERCLDELRDGSCGQSLR